MTCYQNQFKANVLLAPPGAYNPSGVTFVHWSMDSKLAKVPLTDQTHPFYGLSWYKPDNLLPENSNVNLFVVGVLRLDDVTTKIINLMKSNDGTTGFVDVEKEDGLHQN